MSGGVQINAATSNKPPSRAMFSFMIPAVTKVGTRLAGTKRELTTTSMPCGVENQPAHWLILLSLMNHLNGALVIACRPKNRPIE